MRVAVYDRFWATGGGGEKFAAGIAAALAGDHDVTLLAHEPLDTAWLGERLQLDLSGIAVHQVAGDRAGAVALATADFDLFVNASFLSRDTNRARRGLYVVHFPGFRSSALHRLVGQVSHVARIGGLDRGVEVVLGDGFYAPDPVRLHTLHWTGPEAELHVRRRPAGRRTATVAERHREHLHDAQEVGRASAAPGDGDGDDDRADADLDGTRAVVTVLLGRYLPAPVAPTTVTAEVDGQVVGRAEIDAPASRFDRRRVVPLNFELGLPAGETVVVTLRSRGWVPHEHGIGTDDRELGVPVLGWHAARGWRGQMVRAVPLLATEQDARFGALDSYDQVLANSEYTRGWIRRMWGRDSEVLYPPVTLVPRQPKRPLILSVGRFFAAGTGHSKKQLELVRAFRALLASGRADGYELHLVGGCAAEHRSYLDQVTAEAEGLPVVLHPDASGAELRQLYGEAAIYWHAAGLGEDADRHPERFEHFGITTVEAMSAGAVPVVIDAAGQTEIVEHGVSGYRFGNLDELVRHTVDLVADPELHDKMSRAAEERARTFGWDAFVTHVRQFV